MSLVGVDIGNSCCVVALAKQRQIQVLLNNDGKYETQSMVSFADNRRKFGSEAASSYMMNLTSTVSQLKRLIGKQYDWVNQEDLKVLPFQISKDEDGGILIHINHRENDYMFKPVHILAMLLSHLMQMIERNGQQFVSHCVIGVPSYFTDKERIAYRDAAKIVELKNLQLMNEGTAIALGYGFYKTTDINEPYHVVFVDIGHSDTQVTVVLYDGEDMQVLAHASDPNLGGRDFDTVLFSHFSEEFKDSFKIDITGNARACARLMEACEKVKKALTCNNDANISVESLMDNKDLIGSITRKKFEELVFSLLQRVWIPCSQALKDARLSIYQQYSVELVGSGSRIPAIGSILEQRFGKPMNRTLNASECVARGCALQAASLSSNLKAKAHKVRDAIPFDVGFCTYTPDEKNDFLFYKGAKFPNTTAFGFPHINQTLDIGIGIVVNNLYIPTRSYKVGKFSTSTSELPILEASIDIDADGIISLKSATLSKVQQQRTSGHALTTTATKGPPEQLEVTDVFHLGMTQIDLTQIKDMENMLTSQDKLVEQAQQRRNELEAYILETKKKLNRGVYQDLVTFIEKEYYLKKLHEMENWLEHHDEKPDIYLDQLEEIKNIFSPIVFRQNNNAECTESTKELEDCINGQRAAANSMTDFKFPEAVYKEIKEAEEWLTACKQLQNMLPKSIDKSQLICEIRQQKKALQESCHLIQTDYNRWFSMKRHYGAQATYPLAQMDGDNASPQIYAKLENKSAPGPMSVFKWFGGFLFGNSRNNEVGDNCQSSRPISNNDVPSLKTKTDGHPEFSPRPSTAVQASDLSTDVKREDMTSKSTENDNNLPDVKVDGPEENEKREVDSEENEKREVDKCMQSAREWFESCRSFATESESEKITGTLDEIDKWVHNDLSAKSQKVCMEKQLMIKKLLEPIVVRVLVERTRLEIRDLLYCIFRYRVEAISSNEFEKDEINKFCNEAEQWLLSKMKEQNPLSNDVPPALHPDEIMQRINDLNMSHATIMEARLKIMEINLKDYMSEIQQKLDGRYNSFINASERKEISDKIAWVYTRLDDNRNSKSRNFLSDSLSELMQLFDPIERRFKDREDSQTAIDQLTDLIRGYRVRANLLSDRKISSKVNKTCDEYQNWLDNVDPVLLSTQVNVKLRNIQVICNGLLDQTSQRASSTNKGCYWGSQHPVKDLNHQGTTGMRSPKRQTSNSNLNSVPRNRGNSNPSVYVNIKIGQAMVGQMVIEMFMDVVPKTAGNFLALCTGEKHVSYVGSIIDRVIPRQLCQGGIYTIGQGTIFGVPSFAQENFFRKHTHRGVLSMLTDIRDPTISHGSGFIICFRNAPELDGKCVVFGKITEGMDILDQIEAVGTQNGVTREDVVIIGCGRIN